MGNQISRKAVCTKTLILPTSCVLQGQDLNYIWQREAVTQRKRGMPGRMGVNYLMSQLGKQEHKGF